MIKSNYDDVKLARRFIEMSEKFLAIYKAGETKVDFEEPRIRRNYCGTVACHGGFAAVALKVKTRDHWTPYELGSEALAAYLGFTTAYELKH